MSHHRFGDCLPADLSFCLILQCAGRCNCWLTFANGHTLPFDYCAESNNNHTESRVHCGLDIGMAGKVRVDKESREDEAPLP